MRIAVVKNVFNIIHWPWQASSWETLMCFLSQGTKLCERDFSSSIPISPPPWPKRLAQEMFYSACFSSWSIHNKIISSNFFRFGKMLETSGYCTVSKCWRTNSPEINAGREWEQAWSIPVSHRSEKTFSGDGDMCSVIQPKRQPGAGESLSASPKTKLCSTFSFWLIKSSEPC